MSQPLLQIKNLNVDFNAGKDAVKALQNISFDINRGEVVAVVGESGSGKSVTSLSILQLLPPPPISTTTGEILFSKDDGNPVNLVHLPPTEMRRIRGNDIANDIPGADDFPEPGVYLWRPGDGNHTASPACDP